MRSDLNARMQQPRMFQAPACINEESEITKQIKKARPPSADRNRAANKGQRRNTFTDVNLVMESVDQLAAPQTLVP